MKQKDLLYLVIAVVILLIAGYVMYVTLIPQNPNDAVVKVDKIGDIPSELSVEGMKQLMDPIKAKNFSSPIEFSGLPNNAPFGR